MFINKRIIAILVARSGSKNIKGENFYSKNKISDYEELKFYKKISN